MAPAADRPPTPTMPRRGFFRGSEKKSKKQLKSQQKQVRLLQQQKRDEERRLSNSTHGKAHLSGSETQSGLEPPLQLSGPRQHTPSQIENQHLDQNRIVREQYSIATTAQPAPAKQQQSGAIEYSIANEVLPYPQTLPSQVAAAPDDQVLINRQLQHQQQQQYHVTHAHQFGQSQHQYHHSDAGNRDSMPVQYHQYFSEQSYPQGPQVVSSAQMQGAGTIELQLQQQHIYQSQLQGQGYPAQVVQEIPHQMGQMQVHQMGQMPLHGQMNQSNQQQQPAQIPQGFVAGQVSDQQLGKGITPTVDMAIDEIWKCDTEDFRSAARAMQTVRQSTRSVFWVMDSFRETVSSLAETGDSRRVGARSVADSAAQSLFL